MSAAEKDAPRLDEVFNALGLDRIERGVLREFFVDCMSAAEVEAWERGAYAGRAYQKRLYEYAHITSIAARGHPRCRRTRTASFRPERA